MLVNHVFRWLTLFYTHLLLLLQPSVLRLLIMMQSHRQSEFLREFRTLGGRVTPPVNVYVAEFDPGWDGHPTYYVNVIKLKWEIIWTGGLPNLSGLPHLRGLPHLSGVPHLHENKPLAESRLQLAALEVRIRIYFKNGMTLYWYWASCLRLSKM